MEGAPLLTSERLWTGQAMNAVTDSGSGAKLAWS